MQYIQCSHDLIYSELATTHLRLSSNPQQDDPFSISNITSDTSPNEQP